MLGALAVVALATARMADAHSNDFAGPDYPGNYAVNQAYSLEFVHTGDPGESWEGHELFSKIDNADFVYKASSYDHDVTWNVVNQAASTVYWKDQAEYVVPPDVTVTHALVNVVGPYTSP